MIAPASPGMFSRIDEMRPPYSQPMYTAASRISAVSGGSFRAKASGIRIATPLIGPRPGSRPTTVPISVPIAAIDRLFGRQRDAEALTRCCSVSISSSEQNASRPVGSTTSSSLSNSR